MIKTMGRRMGSRLLTQLARGVLYSNCGMFSRISAASSSVSGKPAVVTNDVPSLSLPVMSPESLL